MNNKVQKTYYVYLHLRPNTTDVFGVFYVGKGCGRRANQMSAEKGRNKYHQRIVKKYGPENIVVKILKCESDDHAKKMEILMISSLRRMGVTLTNMTDGGEGVVGFKHSEDAKERIRKFHKGWRLPPEAIERMRVTKSGIKLSDEHKAKIGAGQKGRISPMLGKQHSTETKEKMSIAGKNKVFSDTHRANLSAALMGHRQTKEVIEKSSDKKRKSYLVTNPNNEKIVVKGIKLFCRENNLHAGHMASIATGKMKSYKGWKCEYLTEEKATPILVSAA
jgi:group I intron endonuclease